MNWGGIVVEGKALLGAMSQIFEKFGRNNYNNNNIRWILLSAASHWEKKSPMMISLQFKAKWNSKWASLIAVAETHASAAG